MQPHDALIPPLHSIGGSPLAGALAELREGAELLASCRYLDLVRDGVVDLGDWLGDAIGELKATPTCAEEAAFRAEQAELHERLWRR